MVVLVTILQSAQDRNRILGRRFIDHDFLKTTLERLVLLEIFLELVERRSTDRTQLTARQGRFENIGGIHRTRRLAGSDQRMNFVDEEQYLALAGGHLLHDGLQTLLELTLVLGACDQRTHVQRVDDLRFQVLGHVAVDDPPGDAFGDGRLADARLADQNRIVFCFSGKDADDVPDFTVASDYGVEFSFLRALHKIEAIFVQRVIGAFRVVSGHTVCLDSAQLRGKSILRNIILPKQKNKKGEIIMGKNAIVGQSGGPTSVINASLAGVFESCKNRGADVVYGMCNGVAGLLEERVVDLSTVLTDDLDIELLKRTPSSFLGSCRYKLPDPDVDSTPFIKLFTLFDKYDICAVFYIGGNDSMDTIGKLAEYGERIQSDIRFMGVPKTIDNDLMVTDHTPGYGSAAKYIGVVMKEIIRDATVYGTKYVTVVEIMGRNAGWLTAAAALAKSDDCEGVDMICLPEVPFNVERFVEKVRVMQEKKPSIVIAVSEGVKLEDGRYVCELADDVHAVDAFGHKALTGTARYLANVVARNLDTKTRCIELSTLQRCAGHLTSRTDITEAYQVGGAAAKAAFEGVTGQMVALKRISNNPYQCTTELHPISEVANLEKKVPLSWMNNNHTQMTEDFLDYARPLIQAELTPLYIAGLPHHIYMKNQK